MNNDQETIQINRDLFVRYQQLMDTSTPEALDEMIHIEYLLSKNFGLMFHVHQPEKILYIGPCPPIGPIRGQA